MAAMRFGQRGGIAVTAIIAILALAGTAQGLGPFARPLLTVSVLAFQISLCVLAVAVLSLAANVTERQEAQRELQAAHDLLEIRAAERIAELLQINTALTQEIIEHRQAKRQLEFQACVLRHMDEGVFLVDEGSIIIYANEVSETMFGCAAGELLGLSLTTLLDDGMWDRQRVSDEIESRLDTGKTWLGELITRKRDGTSFATVARISPLEISGMKFWVCVQNDRSELKQAREHSLQLERLAAIGQMVAGLAHESGNALQQIQGAVEMLARRVDGDAETRLLDQIQQAQDRLRRLLEDLRGYAAPIRLDRRWQDVANLWREAWRQLRSQRGDREIQFHEFLNGVDLNCLVDPFPMERVFRNILENSLAACADPVRIEVSCSECRHDHQPAVSLSFRDNGPGLNAEQCRRLFEPFFTTKTKGTGLGMAISQRLVDAHGGQISGGCGNDLGTNIIIILPKGTP